MGPVLPRLRQHALDRPLQQQRAIFCAGDDGDGAGGHGHLRVALTALRKAGSGLQGTIG